MTRREFIGAAVAAAAAGGRLDAQQNGGFIETALPAADGRKTALPAVDGIQLPEWAVKIIRDGVARYIAWKGNDETVTFPLITDVHSHAPGFNAEAPDWGDSKGHVIFQRAIAHATSSDFLSNLGDLDFDLGIGSDKAEWPEVQGVIDGFVKVYEKESLPVLFCVGNHDHAKGRYTSKQFGDTFNRGINNGKGHNIVLSECGSWGYYDIPAKKFRAIFLNTSDEGYIGFSREQLQFLADSFASTPEDWTAMVLQHVQAPGLLGRCRRYLADAPLKREAIFMQIIDDFVHRRGDLVKGWNPTAPKGEYDKIKWDYASRKTSFFAGSFFGHTHLEGNIEIDGMNWTTRPGYGTACADVPAMGSRDPKRDPSFNRRKDMMLDLVAVKLAKRRVHVFRFGCGGPKSELEYAY